MVMIAAAVCAVCCGERRELPDVSCPVDMALIYYGNDTRPAMDRTNMAKYLYRMNGDSLEWMFDGFLFLEIQDNAGGQNYDYGIPHDDFVPARKIEWEKLLRKNFADGAAFDAAEKVLDSIASAGVRIPYRRQMVIALPNPHPLSESWGEIDGRKMDFTDADDRFTAVKWYIDENLERWRAADYRYLGLCGFYWLHEELNLENHDDVLVKRVSDYLKGLGYPLCWIPWNGAPGADKWKESGFGIAWQQPNYFFYDHVDSSAVSRAADFAREYGLYMEMEFDGRVSEEKYACKFYLYLRQFGEMGVWRDVPVAYYEGGGAWLDLVDAGDRARQEMCRRLGDILAERKRTLKVNVL